MSIHGDFYSTVQTHCIAPYYQASKHFTIACSGKVSSLSQRVFADSLSIGRQVSIKERAIHLLAAAALGLPLINFITYFVFEKLHLMIEEKPKSQSVRFGPEARARLFMQDESPEELSLKDSITFKVP